MIKLKSWSWKAVFGPYDRIGENHGDAGKGQVLADRFESIKRGRGRGRKRIPTSHEAGKL